MQTGLLNSENPNSYLPGLAYDDLYFTQRQKEIIMYMIRGKTAKEIGLILNISKRTVEHHIESIKIKSNSTSKPELIEKMIDHFIKV